MEQARLEAEICVAMSLASNLMTSSLLTRLNDCPFLIPRVQPITIFVIQLI